MDVCCEKCYVNVYTKYNTIQYCVVFCCNAVVLSRNSVFRFTGTVAMGVTAVP